MPACTIAQQEALLDCNSCAVCWQREISGHTKSLSRYDRCSLTWSQSEPCAGALPSPGETAPQEPALSAVMARQRQQVAPCALAMRLLLARHACPVSSKLRQRVKAPGYFSRLHSKLRTR